MAAAAAFELGGTRIKVVVDANSDYEKAGVWLPEECEIRLYPKGRSYDYMMVTWYHELFHAILDSYGRPEESTNEDLMDVLAQGLMQYFKSAKFDA